MRYRWDKKYLYWGITAFCVIAASIIFYIAVSNYVVILDLLNKVAGALSPVFYGFVIAYLLSPVQNFFEKNVFMKAFTNRELRKPKTSESGVSSEDYAILGKKKISRILALIVTMTLFGLILFGIIIIVLPQMVDTITRLVNNMQGYLTDATTWANTAFKDYPDVQAYVTGMINNASTYLMDFLKNNILPQMTDIVSVVSSSVYGVITVFFNIFFGIVISIYFLYSRELFTAQLKKILYSVMNPRFGNAVMRNMREIHRTFGGFISGKILESLILTVLYFCIMSVFNFPYAMLCAVLMGIFNIIPVFGPIIGAVPCVLLILMENPIYVLYFIIIMAVIQQLDGNFIGPKVLGESTGLSSFWVIFALLVGQGIFGFWGLIIGIPLFAVIYAFFRGRVGRKLEKKGLPSDSNVYRKVAYVDQETNELISLYEISEKEKLRQHEQELREQVRHGMKKKLFKRKYKDKT